MVFALIPQLRQVRWDLILPAPPPQSPCSLATDNCGVVTDDGSKSNCSSRTSCVQHPTTTTTTTTTTTKTMTTTECAEVSRYADATARRWLNAAMIPNSKSQQVVTHRACAVLSQRPSSTVLDAIRAIEARQLPLTTHLDAERQPPVSRRSVCRLVDIVRRPASSLHAARCNHMQLGHGNPELGQGQLEGQ